jgi:tetratricopeptide (TPR) repeat protein
MSNARTLLVVAAVAAFAVVGTLAFAFVSQNRVDVYFDNGLPKRLSVSVDGEVFPLGNAEPKKRALAPGIHEVVVSDDTGEIERARIEIAKKDLMGALLEREFYVYNVAQAHIYRRAHHVYAVAESDRAYSEEIFAFQQFFSQPKADFLFKPAPSEMMIDGESAAREEFVVASDLDYNVLATTRFSEGNVEEAKKAVDKALSLDPCHADAFRNRFGMLMVADAASEAAGIAVDWIAACAETGIEPHRAYQDTMSGLVGRDSIVAEYRKRRDREPTAENDYLLARLTSGEASLPLYRDALSKDPTFARARLALAYDLMGLERYDEAATEIAASMDSGALLSEGAQLLGYAAIGAGRVAEVSPRLSALGAQLPFDAAVWEARFLAALALSDWIQGERLLQEYKKWVGIEPVAERIRFLRLKGDEEEADQRIAIDAASGATLLQFQSLYLEGRYEEAARILSEVEGGANELYRLYAFVGLEMAGLSREATTALSSLESDLVRVGFDAEADFYRALVDVLRGRASEEQALTAAREAGFMMIPHAYFLLAAHAKSQGNAEAASAYFRRSAATAVTLDFPYLAAKSEGKPLHQK